MFSERKKSISRDLNRISSKFEDDRKSGSAFRVKNHKRITKIPHRCNVLYSCNLYAKGKNRTFKRVACTVIKVVYESPFKIL